jgi:hypothetical protein
MNVARVDQWRLRRDPREALLGRYLTPVLVDLPSGPVTPIEETQHRQS